MFIKDYNFSKFGFFRIYDIRNVIDKIKQK